MGTQSEIKKYISIIREIYANLPFDKIQRAAEILLKAYDDGKRVFTMGNGGHGNTASHFINDLCHYVVRADDKSTTVVGKKFKAICLNDSVSLLTAVGNDMGYEHIFSEQLDGWVEEGDVVMGISGSGNSRNILNAFQVASRNKATTICLTGFDGGKAKDVADLCIIVPSREILPIEDVHLSITHILTDVLRKAIQARGKT
ncbi:MAG: D-sedoheptulose-7-phosphate isomerase [bacterium]